MELNDDPKGFNIFHRYIGVFPELALFRRFGPHWSKKLYDDISKVVSSLEVLNTELGRIPELGGNTYLDLPWWIVQKHCPRGDDRYDKLWKAWDEKDDCLMKYGQTLCLSQQIMKFPDQDGFHTKDIAEFKGPNFKPVLDNGIFMPTSERAHVYQGMSGWNDTCAWRAIPQSDFLTMRFTYSSKWIQRNVIERVRRCILGRRAQPDQLTSMEFGRIVGVMDTLTCLLASVLLAVTIWVLATVRSMKWRLVIMGITGTVFSLAVKLMAGNPSRGEVFGATAAFYAVVAVFLSSTNVVCTCH